MKFAASLILLLATIQAMATSGPSDRVKLTLGGEIPKIVLQSSMGHMDEWCTSSGTDSGSDSCHSYYVEDYKTFASIDVTLAESDLDLKGKVVTIDFTGEHAKAITSGKDDLYYEIDVEKKTDLLASNRKSFTVKMTLTPRLQSKTFSSMKMENVKLKDGVITFETLPATDVEMKTTMAASEKKILFYSLVWWKELLSPVIEIAPLAGKVMHTVHLIEIQDLRSGEKYRFDLYRATKKENSLGKFTSHRLKGNL